MSKIVKCFCIKRKSAEFNSIFFIRKQFAEMVKFNKKQTMEEFAEEILRSSPDERRDLLKSYYTHVHPDVSPVFQEASVTTKPKSTTKKG